MKISKKIILSTLFTTAITFSLIGSLVGFKTTNTITKSDPAILKTKSNSSTNQDYYIQSNYEININNFGIDFKDYQIDISKSGRTSITTRKGWVINTTNDVIISINQNTGLIDWSFKLNNSKEVIYLSYNDTYDIILLITSNANNNNYFQISTLNGADGSLLSSYDTYLYNHTPDFYKQQTPILSPIQNSNNQYIYFPPGWKNHNTRTENTLLITLAANGNLSFSKIPISGDYTNTTYAVLSVGAFLNSNNEPCWYQIEQYTNSNVLRVCGYKNGNRIYKSDEIKQGIYSSSNDVGYFNQTPQIQLDLFNYNGDFYAGANILFNYNPTKTFIQNYVGIFQNNPSFSLKQTISLYEQSLQMNIESAKLYNNLLYCYCSYSTLLESRYVPSLVVLNLSNYSNYYSIGNYNKGYFSQWRQGQKLNDDVRINVYTPFIAEASDTSANRIILPSYASTNEFSYNKLGLFSQNLNSALYFSEPLINYAYNFYDDLPSNIASINSENVNVSTALKNINNYINFDEIKKYLGGYFSDATFKIIIADEQHQDQLSNGKILISIEISDVFINNKKQPTTTRSFYLTGFSSSTKLINNTLEASQPLNNYGANELYDLAYKYNKQNEVYDLLKTWMSQQVLFTNYNETGMATFDAIQINSFSINHNYQNAISINFTLLDANLIDGAVGPEIFNLTVINLKNEFANTELLINKISYTEKWFSTINGANQVDVIFGDDKGFGVDWKYYGTTNQAEQLKNYMNNHINTFFNNSNNDANLSSTIVSNVEIIVNDDQNAIANIVFSGFRNNVFISDLKATLSLALRPVPGPDVIYPNQSLNPFINLNAFISDYINQIENFNVSVLRSAISEFLNTQKHNLPNVLFLNDESILFNNIKIIGDLITTTNPINIDAYKIQIFNSKNDFSIYLPSISINLDYVTILIKNQLDISQTSLGKYSSLEVEHALKQEPHGAMYDLIIKTIYDHWFSLFKNYNNPSIQNIILNSFVAKNNNLLIDITVKNARIASGYGSANFTITLTNFNNDNITTTIKQTNISWNNEYGLFKQIFGDNKGFSVDWANESMQANNQLLYDFINKHPSTFFDNVSNSFFLESVSINVNQTRNLANVLVKYSAIVNGEFNTLESNNHIIIYLRPTPGANSIDTNPETNIFLNFPNLINNWFNQNPNLTIDQLKYKIANYLNQQKQNIPNICLPNNYLKDFNTEDIHINYDLIDIKSTSTKFNTGAIYIGNNIQIPFPSFSVNSTNFINIQTSNNTINQNWWIYLVIGLTILVFILLIILIIYYYRRSKNKSLSGDYWDY